MNETNWLVSAHMRKAGAAVKTALFLACLALLLVSCASPGADIETERASTPPIGQAPTPDDYAPGRPYPSVPEGLERVEITPSAPVLGEVPSGLLEDIRKDLSDRLDSDPQEIEVIKGESVLWPDGSLGCPQPGEFYTQAAVPGYWIILQVGTATYDYRASESGHFLLCEQPLPLVSPAP